MPGNSLRPLRPRTPFGQQHSESTSQDVIVQQAEAGPSQAGMTSSTEEDGALDDHGGLNQQHISPPNEGPTALHLDDGLVEVFMDTSIQNFWTMQLYIGLYPGQLLTNRAILALQPFYQGSLFINPMHLDPRPLLDIAPKRLLNLTPKEEKLSNAELKLLELRPEHLWLPSEKLLHLPELLPTPDRDRDLKKGICPRFGCGLSFNERSVIIFRDHTLPNVCFVCKGTGLRPEKDWYACENPLCERVFAASYSYDDIPEEYEECQGCGARGKYFIDEDDKYHCRCEGCRGSGDGGWVGGMVCPGWATLQHPYHRSPGNEAGHYYSQPTCGGSGRLIPPENWIEEDKTGINGLQNWPMAYLGHLHRPPPAEDEKASEHKDRPIAHDGHDRPSEEEETGS